MIGFLERVKERLLHREVPAIRLEDGSLCTDRTFVGGLDPQNVDAVLVEERNHPLAEWTLKEIIPRGDEGGS